MRTNKAKISFIIMLFWVAVIFSFSLQPASDSSELSMSVGRRLAELLPVDVVEKLSEVPREQLDFLHMLLRKIGHFSEYFVLGIFSMVSFLQTELRHKKWLGLGFCVLVAVMDETIQLFVSGRSGQITDVLLDSVGALFGILIVLLIRKLFGSRRNKI